MPITVFGATGGTGREIVRQAADAGHEVTAVIRAGAAPENLAPARVVAADVTSPAGIAAVLPEQTVIVSAIRHRKGGPATICADSVRAISHAAREAGARRLVVVSAALVTYAGDDLVVRRVLKPVVRTLLRRVFLDLLRMEECLRVQDDLAWPLVHPPRLTDAPPTGRYRLAYDANPRRGYLMSRGNLRRGLVCWRTAASLPQTALRLVLT